MPPCDAGDDQAAESMRTSSNLTENGTRSECVINWGVEYILEMIDLSKIRYVY